MLISPKSRYPGNHGNSICRWVGKGNILFLYITGKWSLKILSIWMLQHFLRNSSLLNGLFKNKERNLSEIPEPITLDLGYFKSHFVCLLFLNKLGQNKTVMFQPHVSREAIHPILKLQRTIPDWFKKNNTWTLHAQKQVKPDLFLNYAITQKQT